MTVLFEKQFNTEIKYIKKINNNSVGIVFGTYLEIYSSVDNFEIFHNKIFQNLKFWTK